ncbi:calcium channel protein [Stygiomarasmius scandens]|uniref:Calcium channel protein n=1 Tax=Marasmiellus scandens TaxID=2682957 RepID=A0ABR1J3C7_9AGAR
MDSQGPHSAIRRSSSSSAIDLSRSSSPSLDPTDTVARRRSWGRVVEGQDPLRLEIPSSSGREELVFNDSPTDAHLAFQPYPNNRHYSSFEPEQDIFYHPYHHSGPSTASLIAENALEMEGQREDDEARLTTNMSRNPTEREWHLAVDGDGGGDPETPATPQGGNTPRRRTVRYSVSPSPLKRTGTAIKSMSKTLRRASLRVVNIANNGLEHQVRLAGDDGKLEEDRDEELPDLSRTAPIRGRTLCWFGQNSKVRLKLYEWLVHPWTEPVILLLIIFNAVVLTIQSVRSLVLEDDQEPARIRGYFHSWEDWALFFLFIIFTLEAFARICVNGFLFDPEIPALSIFTSPFSSAPSRTIVSNLPPDSADLSRQGSLSAGGPLARGLSLTNGLTETTSANTIVNEKIKQHVPSASTAHQTTFSLSQQHPPTFFSTAFRSDTKNPTEPLSLPFKLNITEVTSKTSRNVPYLRQSWGRIDFVAIASFWITFILASGGLEHGGGAGAGIGLHIGVFRAMSVIRTARLLAITSGTTTIMHSLKTARPLLASVAYFVVFAMVLFSIIGIQSFNGSLRRSCFLLATDGEQELQISDQFCGGHVNASTIQESNYITWNGLPSDGEAKGYICPLGQICRETDNPEDGIQSFDTIWAAILQIVVVASANGWAPLMYEMIDSEFFVSSLFFIICVVVLNFWLINLFVAVITNTFSAIRSETKKSAFGAAPLPSLLADEQDDGWSSANPSKPTAQRNIFKILYDHSRWIFILFALASLVLQATRTATVSETHETIMYYGELVITLLFDVEILIRFLAALPDWRSFFGFLFGSRSGAGYAGGVGSTGSIRAGATPGAGSNWLDLILAVGSSVIQIPVIRNSEAYPWFTIFQLARFYRVILEVPRMRPLMLSVFGNMYGLFNMSLFLILINYIAALVAVQLLRGDMSVGSNMNFKEIFNAFLAMYQVMSSENWTDVLYQAAEAELKLRQTVLVIILISVWELFANFIILQMFVAVINENFQVAEEQKRTRQASHYWATHQIQSGRATWMRKLNPYRWVKPNPVKVKVENLPSNLVLSIQQDLVQEYRVESPVPGSIDDRATVGSSRRQGLKHYTTKSLSALQKLFAGDEKLSINNDVPLATLKQHTRSDTLGALGDEETERHLELLASVNNVAVPSDDINDAIYERRAQKADFIRDHPSYDRTFWIFGQNNFFRKFCQRLVQPAHGERIFGTPHSPLAHPAFQFLILLAVIGGIVTEIIATPVYRRNYFAENGRTRGAWFDIAEGAFTLTLIVEFFIKICADGFAFTPNAYVRSIWNIIDFIILAGISVNVATSLIFVGGLSRFTRSLKALRALRLITLFNSMRVAFQSLIISGASRILDAAVLAILYIIPYAVWGLNIFAGTMKECNDGDATGITDCINEYENSIFDDGQFGFPVPKVWTDPSPSTTYSFDNFRSSLLILFEIVSLEGWIDVMNIATSIAGKDAQPDTNASEWNALFFLVYHLVGGVVILTLFVSIIIANFSSRTGTAFLTQPQKEWIDLQKLFKRQKPSKRPKTTPTNVFRKWCFDRAIHKHGWWSRSMTFLFVLHVLVLMTQTYSTSDIADTLRNDFFLVIICVYIIDVVIRLVGLGWKSFRANGWNLFDILVTAGSFFTTLIVRFGKDSFVIEQLQKLFLVSIAFKLVQRTDSLNKLFKTSVASLPAILSLLVLWFIFFMFFAILYVEVFGLTKWGGAETRSQNYSTIGSALVMLAFMSTGEGWNEYMHNYARVYPLCTNSSDTEEDSDCGSVGWAFTLFIAWNILSMYIFVNLFTGVVVDSFSYVFQTSGGAKSITREQMRAFKKVWAEYANPKTGYLERGNFVTFFGKLSGVFEVRIYPAEYSIPNILDACKESPDSSYTWPPPRTVDGVDLHKLDAALNGIDYAAIRKRRAVYTRLYHEATIAHQPGRGISFTDMLLLLAHHKLIVDHEALVLSDLVVRTETNKLVTDLVNLDRVHSLLKTISHRRRFLNHLARKRAAESQQEIPFIVVDTMPSTPPQTTRDISSAPSTPNHSPSPSYSDYNGSRNSMIATALQRSKRVSDVSRLSTDLGRYPRDSIIEEDPQLVLSSMQNSMWGDLMSEAMKEEEGR